MSEMNLRQRIVLADFLAKHFAAARKDRLNPEALDEMVPGERLAARFGSRVAAWVSVPRPATRASVVNEKAFTEWVRKNLGDDEILTVEIVRPGTQKALLETAKAHGGMWVNGDGEKIAIPGIKVETGDPAVRIELEDGAAEIIGEAWRDGTIDVGSLLALPVPKEPERKTYPASDPLYMDEHGFFDPERAAHHACVVQGGFSTPPIEAYRMIADGGVAEERARKWLVSQGLDQEDPARGKSTPWPLPAGGDGGE